MIPVYTLEDCTHFVGYSDLAKFIEQNSQGNIDIDEAIDLVYDQFLGCNEPHYMCKRSNYVNISEDDFKDDPKTYWIASFFMSHSFMNTIYFVYED